MMTIDDKVIYEELNKCSSFINFIKNISRKSIEERNKEIDELSKKNVLLGFMNDKFYEAQQIRYPHGVIMNQGFPYSYYRGENKYYFSTKSSFFRNRGKQKGDYLKYELLIARMRIKLFEKLLLRLDLTDIWLKKNYSTILVYCLAQHYGLETEYLDVTSDFLTAMFFATTTYDKEHNQYIPITDEYIKEHKEYEYGYFYKYRHSEPAMIEINDTQIRSKHPELYHRVLVGDVWPIGYQPFNRCSAQFGYFIYCDQGYDMNKDARFIKYKFKQSSSLSLTIFNMCKTGQLIFPYEGISEIQKNIDLIKTTNTFSKSLFEEITKDSGGLIDNSSDDIRKELASHKVQIIDGYDDLHPIISEEELAEVNKKYINFNPEEYYGIKPWYRLVKYGD